MRAARREAALLMGAAVLAGATAAGAHDLGLSRGDYAVEGATLRAELTFARAELPRLAAGLDGDGDGVVTQAELDAGRDALQGALVGRMAVSGDGAACPGALDRVELVEGDGVFVRASFRCPRRPHQASVSLALLQGMPAGHRHLVRAVAAEGPLDTVITQHLPTFAFAPPPEEPAPRRARLTWTLPACLAGLLARRPERAAMERTAVLFALGALLGAAAASLGHQVPGARALGFAAAVSLIYVGLDPLLGAGRSSLVALPFGAAHGLVPSVAPGALAWHLAELAVVVALAAALLGAVIRSFARAPRLVSLLVAAAGLAALARLYFGPS